MQLFAVLLVLNIHFYHIFAFPPDPIDLSVDRAAPSRPLNDQNLKGYECGNVFFSDLEIDETLRIALETVGRGFTFPQSYLGKLYSEAKYKEHLLWPIKKGSPMLQDSKFPKTSFRIVFTKESDKAVDVISKITTDEYTRCIRKNSRFKGLSTLETENPNGYTCGHRFFTDDNIKEYLFETLRKIQDKGRSLAPYAGLLYPGQNRMFLMPYLSSGFFKSGKSDFGPYCLLVNNKGELIDVVVRGFSSNFLRCIRSRKPPKAPASDPLSKLFVPAPKTGYQCGRVFFEDKALEENAEIAKSQASHKTRSQYPKEYSGDPFNEPCLIWPIYIDGSLVQRGKKGPYRLILTIDYHVKTVVMVNKGEFKPCERKKLIAKKNPDTSDYFCGRQYFSHHQLRMAADEACKRKNRKKSYYFPTKYEGLEFESDGPYFIYPVLPDGPFTRYPGPNRVVMDANCDVVGALTTHQGKSSKELVKCHRLADGPLPDNYLSGKYSSL